MKKLTIIFLAPFLMLLASCGARDDKNKEENYPTYDTTDQTNIINDSSNAEQHGEGGLRYNLDGENRQD